MVVYSRVNAHTMAGLLLNKNSYGDFKYRIFDYHGRPYDFFEDINHAGRDRQVITIGRLDHVAEHEIIVASDNFAKPPPKWIASIVRWFFPDNDRDECHFKSRALRSGLLLLVVLPLHYLLKLISLVAYIALGRVYDIDIKQAWKPFRKGPMRAVFGRVRHESAWLYKRSTSDEYDLALRSLWWRISIVAVPSLAGLTYYVSWQTGIGAVSSFTDIVLGACGIAMVTLALYPVVFWINGKRKAKKGKKQERRQQRDIEYRNWLDEQLSTMSCDTRDKPMTIEALKYRRRHSPTVLYYGLKDAVCKPFAR